MTEDSTGTIGRYEIEREIGRGGMAVVYKARDPRLDRWVAIKLIQAKAFAANIFGHIRERFEREAKALARLDHPNIVKVLDYGEHEGAPYLVMDYLEGATLKEVRKPLRVETAVRLLRPIAEALDYVHRHGLLHRDIKPSNIMITKEEQRVILTDFGIAKWIEEESELQTLTGTGVGIGTPEYMSPEQGRGKKVDERSDMYSLAIVFYELITGKKPYTGDTPLDVLMNQVSVPIPDPRAIVPEINESVKRFLDRAMAKKPDDRYATMKDFLRDFDGLRLQSLAEPAKTGQTQTGIQTVAKADSATDSSIRFGGTDFRKIETAAQEASAKREPQAGIQRPRASRRYGRSIALAGGLAVLALIAGISALRSRNRQQLPTTAAVDAALAAIELGLAETQRALPLAQTQAAQTLEAGRIAQEATLEAAIAGITTTAESALRSTAVSETQTALLQAQTQAAQTLEAGRIAQEATLEAAIAGITMTAESALRSTAVSETQRAVISAQETQSAAAATATAASLNPYAGVSVGDTIEFGRYEQDNDLSNGAEAIEWLVLDVSDGSALVTSRYGLDAKAYNEEDEPVSWETSTIRAWLNGEFYASAFMEQERRLIELSEVKNADNPEYGTNGGNDTQDRVFLLSLDEAERYFADDDARRLKPTDYAVARDVWEHSDNGNAWWLLRSPGYSASSAAVVISYGSLSTIGNIVSLYDYAVRPALRIKIGN